MGWPKGKKRGPRAREPVERESSDSEVPARVAIQKRGQRTKRTSFAAFTTFVTALVVGSDAVEQAAEANAQQATVAQVATPVPPAKRKRIQVRP